MEKEIKYIEHPAVISRMKEIYEGNAVDIVSTINEILETQMSVKE